MKNVSIAFLATCALLCQSTHAYWKGFNLGANLPNGACKSPADWEKDFRNMASLPGHFTSARLYASSDCNTLANAVPAAIKTGTTILVGIWAEDASHFNAEKQALLAAIRAHGTKWIISVSVGSEDLYRGNTDGHTLAGQIRDVRGMLWSVGAGSIEVGHVDTWTAWVKPENAIVIQACDFVGTDGYPYYQDQPLARGYNVFWDSVNAVRAVVGKVKPGTWVWITETGWPVSGATLGSAVPSVHNAQTYWKGVACQAFREAHTFWFVLQDYTARPSFGVLDGRNRPLFDLSCPK